MPKKQHETNLPHRQPTKRQLDKWERQRYWQRIIIAVSAFVIGAVIIYVTFSYVREEVLPRYEPAVRVNDTVYDIAYYSEVLAVYGRGDPSSIVNYSSVAARDIQYNELMRRAALDLGISVDEAAIDELVSGAGLPNSQPIRDIARAGLLAEKLRTDYFGLQVPPTADQVNAQVMFLGGEVDVLAAKARLEKGDDFVTVAKELSVDSSTRDIGGNLGWKPKELLKDLLGSDVIWDTASKMEKGALSGAVFDSGKAKATGYWIIQVTKIDPDGGARYTRAILLSTPEQANDIRAKIVAGEDLATLAKEYSQDAASKDKGGEFGTIPENASGDFRNAALALQENEISQPVKDAVQTTGGYWLVKLIDRESNRTLDEDSRNQLVNKAFAGWAEGLAKDATLENYLDPDKLQWVIDHI
jgi:parvulin-like peptidyl-prolyl isomerase